MQSDRAKELLQKFIERTLSEAERLELERILLEDDVREALEALMAEAPEMADYREEEWDPMFERVMQRAPEERHAGKVRRMWAVRVAAAALLVALGTALFWRRHEQPPVTAALATDVAPGGNKATLTLANGSTIDLNAAGEGLVNRQGDARIVKQDSGAVAYQTDPGGVSEGYNTLTTPRGGQYRLTLSDGSKVWLNAASSLRYPPTFRGGSRVVEVTGEAYFEIARRSDMPFKVVVHRGNDEETVDVLGTHFNVMAYTDEPGIQTTLLEGAIRVRHGTASALLSPGEQASYDMRRSPVDTDEVVAWKNGLFRFNAASLPQVMRQVARWYDVEVVYENAPPPDLFRGEMYRNAHVSQLLRILQASGVRFTVQGKKIFVQR